MKKLRFIFLIVLFIAIDQGTKLYIKHTMMNDRFHILGDIIQFRPKINREYSWFNSFFSLGVNKRIHIIFTIIILLVVIVAYQFVRTSYGTNQWMDVAYMAIIAGATCSFIDKVFWGGSLDYILIKDWFIFDLKDAYITVFEVICISLLIKNYEKAKGLSNKMLLADFKKYIRGSK